MESHMAALRLENFYRTVTIHAALQITMEYRAQLQNEEGLSPITLRLIYWRC